MDEMIRDNDEIEIDLMEIFRLLLRKAWMIILCLIVGAVLMFGYTKFLVVPQYTASSMIYILGESTSITSIADVQIGTELASDFITLAKSRPTLESVIDDLNLDMNYEELSKTVNVENLTDTHILKISATNPDPKLAKEISNSLADETAKTIADVMVTDKPSLAERAIVPKHPSSPNLLKNVALGGMLGALLAIAVIVIRHLMDDTIKTEEDVKKYLQVNTFAALPLEKGSGK